MNQFKFEHSLIRHALCLSQHSRYSLKFSLKGLIKTSEIYTHVLNEEFREIKTHEITNQKKKRCVNTQVIMGIYTPFY
jgi:hypothetical protein